MNKILRTVRRTVLVGVLSVCCFAGGYGLAVGALHILMVVMIDATDPFNDDDFDRALWLAHGGDSSARNPRGPMARDLQRILLRERPNRASVVGLLGDPDSPSDASLESRSYLLGAWSRASSDTLDIYFDDEGRVRRALVVGPDS